MGWVDSTCARSAVRGLSNSGTWAAANIDDAIDLGQVGKVGDRSRSRPPANRHRHSRESLVDCGEQVRGGEIELRNWLRHPVAVLWHRVVR